MARLRANNEGGTFNPGLPRYTTHGLSTIVLKHLKLKRKLKRNRSIKEALEGSKPKGALQRSTKDPPPVVLSPFHPNKVPKADNILNKESRSTVEAHPAMRVDKRVSFRRVGVEPVWMSLVHNTLTKREAKGQMVGVQ